MLCLRGQALSQGSITRRASQALGWQRSTLTALARCFLPPRSRRQRSTSANFYGTGLPVTHERKKLFPCPHPPPDPSLRNFEPWALVRSAKVPYRDKDGTKYARRRADALSELRSAPALSSGKTGIRAPNHGRFSFAGCKGPTPRWKH
jgi:hypothetical protein